MSLLCRKSDMLMEGLDVLPNKDSTSDLMIEMLDSMMAKSKEDAEAAIAKRNEKMKQKEGERKQLLDKIVLLKAKLINMKDGVLVDAVIGER